VKEGGREGGPFEMRVCELNSLIKLIAPPARLLPSSSCCSFPPRLHLFPPATPSNTMSHPARPTAAPNNSNHPNNHNLTTLPPELLQRLLTPTPASAASKHLLKTLLDALPFPPEQKSVLWKLLARCPNPGYTVTALTHSVRTCGLGATVLWVRQGFQFIRDGRRAAARGGDRDKKAGERDQGQLIGSSGDESSGDASSSSKNCGGGGGGTNCTEILPEPRGHRATSYLKLLELLWTPDDVEILLRCAARSARLTLLPGGEEAVTYFDGLAMTLLPVWESREEHGFMARVAWLGKLRRLPVSGEMEEGKLVG
jgi:hypothetical protein